MDSQLETRDKGKGVWGPGYNKAGRKEKLLSLMSWKSAVLCPAQNSTILSMLLTVCL